MKKLLAISTLGLSALALTAGQASAAVLIDNFNTGDIFEEVLPGNTVSGNSVPSPGDAISTERGYNFQVIGRGRSRATLSVDGAAAGGGIPVMSISNPAGVTSVATLTYATGGPFNLAAGGENLMAFNILSNDRGATVKLTVDGVDFEANTLPLQTGPLTVPFSAFPGVDFTSVGNIQLQVSGPDNYDFVIDNFESRVIPEPMTILGTGFALAALPGLKKAHKNKKAQ